MIFKWRILIFRDAEAGFDEIVQKLTKVDFSKIFFFPAGAFGHWGASGIHRGPIWGPSGDHRGTIGDHWGTIWGSFGGDWGSKMGQYGR